MAKTWTRSPADPAKGVGLVYTRDAYRVERLGKAHGWQVWHGGDFLAPTQKLAEGKALTWEHEIGQAWTAAGYEDKARGLSDWNLRQAHQGAIVRNREDQAAIYRAELDRRKALVTARNAAHEAAVERARTEYTMHAYRAPFSGDVFNHIMGPGTGRSLCGKLHGGPGEVLDLAYVDCLPCMEAYAKAMLAARK